MFDFFIKGLYNNFSRGHLMNTDYNLYKIFLYLYEEKSISKTANRLYVSQPAISYSLKELEKQLGYTLFYRNSKGIEPTMEAKELYNYISTAFNILNDAEEHIKNLNHLNIGCIRIGVPTYIGVFYLTDVITSFRKQFPGISFEVVSMPMAEMVEMLEMRKLDVIVGTLPINSKKNVTKITLSKFHNCFAYYKGKIKDVSISSMKDLEKYPLILPDDSFTVRLKLDEYMESKNIQLHPVLEGWSTEIMLSMARNGVGIGYFIQDIIEQQIDKDKFEILTFDNDLPDVDVCCVYIEEFLTRATKKFIDLLKENKK